MRLQNCEVTNFGSYSHLQFNFDSLGLALVYGKTGSGKSTIPDIAAWILYGTTAKDGSVDDVRSWQAPDDPTTGALEVETPEGPITVYRVRGKAGQNDLYWLEGESDQPQRGKDASDTQKRLEARLGVTADLYLTGAYFHEFSATGGFFTAKAKERRAVFERIASMDLAIQLGSCSSDKRKEVKKGQVSMMSFRDGLAGQLRAQKASLEDTQEYIEGWNKDHVNKLLELEASSKNFDKLKQTKIAALQTKFNAFEDQRDKDVDSLCEKIEKLDASIKPDQQFIDEENDLTNQSRCKYCKGVNQEVMTKIKAVNVERSKNAVQMQKAITLRDELSELSDADNPFTQQLKDAEQEVNHYDQQREEEKAKINPFLAQLEKIKATIEHTEHDLKNANDGVAENDKLINALSTLYDLSMSLRGELLKKAVKEIQDSTNQYLEKYFDSEIRVTFSLEGSDELDVEIQKSGFVCNYKQLSKGQRQLLKLSFSVSIMMAAANKAGIHFSTLFFDEALDGLDSDLKIKAFSLFEELEKDHGSILLIDHAQEFHQLFSKRYHVTMENDVSSIYESEND